MSQLLIEATDGDIGHLEVSLRERSRYNLRFLRA
jgi:hypothetical protein